MTNSHHLDLLVSTLADLADAVREMKVHYTKIPALIASEHDAITQAELDKVEEISRLKLEVGSTLDADFSRIKECLLAYSRAHQKSGGKLPDHIMQLSDCFVFVDERLAFFQQQGLDTQALKLEFETLKGCFEEFLALKEESRSSVEVNKLVLAQLLANRQENYRFWQEIASETAAAYDGTGKKRDHKNRSTLTVKA